MKYAVLNNNTLKVVNIVEWDGVTKWSPPKDHYVMQSDQANIGQIYEVRTKSFVDDPKTIKNKL